MGRRGELRRINWKQWRVRDRDRTRVGCTTCSGIGAMRPWYCVAKSPMCITFRYFRAATSPCGESRSDLGDTTAARM